MALCGALAGPALADVTPLACLFRPDCTGAGCGAQSYLAEIAPADHAAGLWLSIGAAHVPLELASDAGGTLTLISAGAPPRDVITIFGSGEALHTRHIQRPGQPPEAETFTGQCEVL